MSDLQIVGDDVYMRVTSDELSQRQGELQSHIDEVSTLLEEVSVLEEYIETRNLGSCVAPMDGHVRLVEYDAPKVKESDFGERLAAVKKKTKLEIYPLPSSPWGNAILFDRAKPIYNPRLASLDFSISSPASGNPCATNALAGGPLWAGNTWENPSGNSIISGRRFRCCFEITVSENFWDYFGSIKENTRNRFLTFAQCKASHSWYNNMLLALAWDYDETEPAFKLHQYGSTSLTEQRPFETFNTVKGIPMKPGVRRYVEIDCLFDSTGNTSQTHVAIDGESIISNDSVNCFATDNTAFPFGVVRGVYFGGYWGATPTPRPYGEPIFVRYSNLSIDVYPA